MFCNNCGTELEDGMMFCSNCGAEVASGGAGPDDDDKTVILSEEINETENTAETANIDMEKTEAEKVETVEVSPTGVVETGTAMVVSNEVEQKRFCPNCGTENGINDLFCQECGMFFGNAEEKMAGGNTAAKTGKAGKVWKIAAIVAALLVVVGLGIIFVPRFIGGGRAAKKEDLDFVMYLKDNELTMARKSKYEPIVVGDRMFADKDGVGNGYHYAYDLISYSPDHKYVYYPQKADGSACDLYRKKLGSKKEEGVKIDSQVVDYKVLDNDRLVYIKDNTDRKLYLYQKGESEKIASNVGNLKVSSDGKYMLWKADGKLYVQNTNLKSDKVKLDSDVSSIYGVSEDFGTIVYQKNDNLYVMKGMNDSDKIASDVYNAYVYDMEHGLKIYYMKKEVEKSLSYYDLIADDLLAQDQQIEEPRIEDYQRITYEDGFWGLREVIEVDESYDDELNKYWQKQNRDSLREYLENNMVDISECDIYYYEDAAGDSNKVLTVSMQGGIIYGIYGSMGKNTALMYVGNMDLEKIDRVKFSELADIDYYEIEQRIEDEMRTARQMLYIDNGEMHEIDFECEDNYPGIWANEEKHMIYVTSYENGYTELYRFDYRQKDASLELITDELSYVAAYGMDDVCYVNEDDELYFGDKKIDEDVYTLKVWENESILYLTDVDKDGEEGTLHLYQRGKSVEIADDVAVDSYGMFDSDKIAFLTDYNFRKYRGDLNVYDGKKVKKIDSDVTKIIF